MTQNFDVNQTTSRKPNFIAYYVVEGDDDKSYWTRIGAAWGHKDGKGLNIDLELIPVGTGKITLRVPEEKKAKPAEADEADPAAAEAVAAETEEAGA
jgi:hypothetical protein